MNSATSSASEAGQAAELRRQAEERMGTTEPIPADVMTATEARALVHELQVHQIELEMQNEELHRARLEADEAREKYFALFDFAPMGHFLWDQDGRILELNLAGAALLGLDRSAASLKRFGQFVAAEFRGAFADFLALVLATDAKQTREIKLQTNGSPVWVLIEGIAAEGQFGAPRRCRAAVIDITQQKRADELAAANRELQAARRQAEAYRDRYVDLYDHAPLGYVNLDEEGYIQEINLAGAAMLGKEREALTGYEFAEHVAAADRIAFQEHVRRCCGEHREATSELGLITGQGQAITVQIHSIPVGSDERQGTFTKTAITDITERKRAEEAVRESAQAAQAANESKSRFLANVSHELRTPMNAILGMIDVALPKAADPFVQDCLETAKGSADLLLTLLNDLLDSAKIESGKLELKAAPFSLRRMLDQLTSVLAIQVSEKELDFHCRCSDELPDGFVGDRTRLQQVLFNLAGNAIKFTEHGEVEISVRGAKLPEGEETVELEFAVRDTGIGIPPTEQQRLFRPFVQVDASTMRHFGGTGLGLSICKALVELMGGRIWLESEVGRGSTFYFIIALPLAGELPTEDEALSALPPRTVGPLRVLLAEDNLANQKLVDYVLRGRGHQVEMAGEGAEAVYLSERNSYDVILMDVQMPGMDGLEATAAIRRREREGRHVPIIAMTAHAMQSDCERCLAAGMDAYLVKPINGRELIGLIESLAQGKPIEAESKSDAAIPAAAHSAPSERTTVFDADKALERCFDSREMLDTMIQTFLAESEGLLSQMRGALASGDILEVGRLGHRLKGTLVYLGAESAAEAAMLVERFTPAAVEHAIDSLEHRCMTLKAALRMHPFAAGTAPSTSH